MQQDSKWAIPNQLQLEFDTMADFMAWRRTACKLPKVDLPIIKDANILSFIEENHEHRLESKKAQHNQPSRPGAPSQDLMAYWGRSCHQYGIGPT